MTHRIHGKIYDLSDFYKFHPGGDNILKLTSLCNKLNVCCDNNNNNEKNDCNESCDCNNNNNNNNKFYDCTAMFESYHGLANRPFILKLMKKFEVENDNQDENNNNGENDDINNNNNNLKYDSVEKKTLYSFEENGFYRTVVKRVREQIFHVKDENISALGKVKANEFWIQKTVLLFSLHLFFYSVVFLFPSLIFGDDEAENESSNNNNGYLILQCIFAFIAALFQLQWGFCMMHDASHFAIFRKNHWLNDFCRKIWCSWSLWNPSRIWMLHHVYLHHSYTGDIDLDPDIHHVSPYILKHPELGERIDSSATSPIHLMILWVAEKIRLPFKENIDNKKNDNDDDDDIFGFSIVTFIFYIFFPGLWLGQAIMYFLFFCQVDGFINTWNMKYPGYGAPGESFKQTFWEIIIALTQIAIHVYRKNIFISISYIVGMNFSYAMCIVGDHDTYEAVITNHTSVVDIDSNKKLVDWGESQVRNTSNYARNIQLFSILFGSINYQIEHHLFPNVNHVYLQDISKIVKITADEFGIPYNSYPGLLDTWFSFVRAIKKSNKNRKAR